MKPKRRKIGRYVLLALVALGLMVSLKGSGRRGPLEASGMERIAEIRARFPRLASRMESLIGDTLIVLDNGARIRFRDPGALMAAETLLLLEPAFWEIDLRFPGMAIVRGGEAKK